MKPSDFNRDPLLNNRRFEVRAVVGGWQIIVEGGYHLCICERVEIAQMIADSLELTANSEHVIGGFTECTCHERDSSYVCPKCYSEGYRGHMEVDSEIGK